MWTRISDIDRMFNAMDLFRSNLNRMFTDDDRSFGEDFGWKVIDGAPRTNIYDSGDKLQVIAEVPGMAKEDLKVKIQGNYLELSGIRNLEAPRGYNAHRVERNMSEFTRSFTLPAEVNADKIEAVLRDGLLTLVLPKAEAARPKQISIK
jgi:HSP20 family protein